MPYIPVAVVSSSGAASSIWTTQVSEDGSSLANWTQVSGSWSVVSGAFHVDTTGATIARLKYNTSLDQYMGGVWSWEADIKVNSASMGTNVPAGLLFYWPGAASGSPTIQLFTINGSTFQVRGEQDATAARVDAFVPSPTWALDVYANLRIICFGTAVTFVLNGVLVGSSTGDFGPGPGQTNRGDYGFTAAQFVGLICNNAIVDFKNIKFKYMALT
jgi:hypothetical protein